MITFANVSKSYGRGRCQTWVAKNLSTVFPPGSSVGLLGRNGAGKSTLLNLIAGIERPDQGRITSSGSVSWPVGLSGAFHADLTGRQNIKFVARIYGIDTYSLAEFVRDFADLGAHFDQPVRTYSTGMRARLAFGASMGIPFDTYLVDEITSVGDASFRKRSSEVLRDRLKRSGAVVVSHSMDQIRTLCDAVAVLNEGHLSFHDDVETGIAAHHKNLLGAPG